MRLLAISGSLRAASSNTVLLQAAARLAPPGTEVVVYDGLGGLPHFNPDLDTDDPPAPVVGLRQAVGNADGLLISSPEYAHGLAGSLKNGLDWLVRSLEFPFKPVALLNASARSIHAVAQLREVLTTMSARLVPAACITVPLGGRTIDADGVVADRALADPLRAAMESLEAAVAGRDGTTENRPGPFAIRPIAEADLPAVLAIHNDAVLNTTAIFSIYPVDLANRHAVWAERQARGFAFLGAFEGETLLGYATFGDFRPHDGYRTTVEHSIYVHMDHRRRGVAAALMGPLIDAARAAGKHVMVGAIDASNAGSIRLHERFGFTASGLLPQVAQKFDRYLDLLFMHKTLD